VKYAWVKKHQLDFSVSMMCEILKVNRTSYDDWLKSKPSARDIVNKELSDRIKAIFIDSRSTYGTRRIRVILLRDGIRISRRRVGKLMKQMDIHCKTKRKFKHTTDSNHKLPIADNVLDRDFTATKPNQKFVGDITYIWTQEGWLYLATVIDLFSRKVVGWSINKRMKASLVNDALLMAIWSRKPRKGLIWHTDRGSQYAAISHRNILKTHGITQSMSRKGNCWDNSVAESFFHTLKTELTHHVNFKTREEAKQAVFEYIEVFYNRKRVHSANDYFSPEEFEIRMEIN
jgi:transposase InsO family protein